MVSAPNQWTNDPLPDALYQALCEVLSRFRAITVEQAKWRSLKDNDFDLVATVSWRERRAHSKHNSYRFVRRHIVFFMRPQSGLPSFQVNPIGGVIGGFLLKIVRMIGFGSLELKYANRPRLHERYVIHSFTATSARAFISDDALDALEKTKDLRIAADHRGIAVIRDGSRGSPASLDTLLAEASSIVDPLLSDPKRAQHAADAAAGTYAQEASRAMSNMKGVAGKLIKSYVVTREMTEALRREEPPRRVPKAIRKRAYGSTFIGMGIGILLMIVGGPVSSMSLIAELSGKSGVPWTNYVFFIFPLVGFLVFFFSTRKRLRHRRLLRYGRVLGADIDAINNTNVTINNKSIYEIVFSVKRGEYAQRTVRVGPAARRVAQHMKEKNERTWVLADHRSSKHTLWVDGWALENIPD